MCGSDQVGGSFFLQSSLFKSQKKSKKVKKKSKHVKACQKVNFKCHMFVFELVVWWIIFKISANHIEGWSNMKWLFFIFVKFWFIDDIIIWFPGERGGAGHANNQMIIHLKDHMIPVHSVFGDVVTGSSQVNQVPSSWLVIIWQWCQSQSRNHRTGDGSRQDFS